jgi:uncharacterized protein (DUF302 family)
MTVGAREGLVDRKSLFSVDATVERLKQLLETKGVNLFAVIDHSGEAARVGMKMPPTKLLIFGNPRAGTPIMLAAPTSAIDLPLKILVWQDATGTTWVTNNSTEYLQARHAIPPDHLQALAAVDALATAAGE